MPDAGPRGWGMHHLIGLWWWKTIWIWLRSSTWVVSMSFCVVLRVCGSSTNMKGIILRITGSSNYYMVSLFQHTGAVYDSSAVHAASVLKRTRRHMEYHINLEFLWSGVVKYVFDKLRDAVLYPRNMMRKLLPKQFRETCTKRRRLIMTILRRFLTHYCFAQGLSRSLEVTRQVTTTRPHRRLTRPNKCFTHPYTCITRHIRTHHIHVRTDSIHVRTDYIDTHDKHSPY